MSITDLQEALREAKGKAIQTLSKQLDDGPNEARDAAAILLSTNSVECDALRFSSEPK